MRKQGLYKTSITNKQLFLTGVEHCPEQVFIHRSGTRGFLTQLSLPVTVRGGDDSFLLTIGKVRDKIQVIEDHGTPFLEEK